MRAALSDIRALTGVTGVAVLSKHDGRIEHLFPAAFTEKHTERLLELILKIHKNLRGFTRLILRFERVVIHLFNQPDYLLFVTVLPDTNNEHFEAVVRSKFTRIANVLGKPISADGTAFPSRSRAPGSTSQQGDPLRIILHVFNTMTDELAGSRGLLQLGANWRRVRDSVAREYEPVSALAVDTMGHLALRKGSLLEPTADVIEALARLAEQFLVVMGTARPVAEEYLYTQLERHRKVIEPCGFFLFLGSGQKRHQTR